MNTRTINYCQLPEHCRDGMQRYVEQGVPVGDFLTAVLSNDLVEAFVRADGVNALRMADYASFLYNEAPGQCWGSKAKVEAWLKAHRERRNRLEVANGKA